MAATETSVARASQRRARRLLHVLPSLDVGGVQTRLVDIANRLPAGFEHVFVGLDGHHEALSRLDPGVASEIVAAPPRDRPLLRRLHSYARTITAQRPDLLLTYNWGSIEFALANAWTRVPHIHAEDGFGPEEANGQLARRVWIRRLALRQSLVVVPSESLWALAKRSWRISPQRLRRIPNGIDLEKFAPRSKLAARTALGLPGAALIVGWVGALRPEKNLERLLRAFAGLQNHSRLVIVGDGPLRPRLEAIAAELGVTDRVTWLGLRRDVADILPAFDVLALSSDTEQMPIVVMEAMAVGLPVASVDVGDVRTMVSAANQPFVSARAEGALGKALDAILGDDQLRAAVGAANRARAEENFSLPRMVDAYNSLYRALAG